MSSSGRYGDLSAILYLVPFIASGVYGLYAWAQVGLSPVLPSSVYLTVTRDPYLFMVGSVAVMLAIVLDMIDTEPAHRRARLSSLGGTLQSLAVASLVLVVIAAFYANGFLNMGGVAGDFMGGRYGLIFPFVLVLFSYLITAQFKVSALSNRNVLGMIALLLVPASIYEIGKREMAVGVGLAFVLLLLGLAAYILPAKKAEEG